MAALMASMLGLLGVAAVTVVIMAAKGIHYKPEKILENVTDISEDPHRFSTYSLPRDQNLMASVGNGHIATTVFSDTVYMNGLYNGRKGNSHRARIPSWINVRLNSTINNRIFTPVYTLDTEKGVFQVTVDRDRSVVTQRIYAHRFYTRTMVNQINVVSKPLTDLYSHHEIWIAVKLMPGPDSKDITFEPPKPEIIQGRTTWSTCGATKETEDPYYQPERTPVCAFWTSVPDHLVVPHHGYRIFTFVMTVDNNRKVARDEFVKVLQVNGEELYKKHVKEWSILYEQARVEIVGNLQLAKIVNGAWYNLLSSLPAENSYKPLNKYYGLSPTGLPRGGSLDDYEGHNFWDTETWMFPPILLMYPQYANKLLQYRLDTAYVAEQLARSTGHKGYRFPWESAYTGVEVTQPCCPNVATYEQHVSADISFAARQYLATTRDEEWLKHGGCNIVTHIADFWASRATINLAAGFYDIDNVMGPDEDHENVKNSAYTNVAAGYSLYLAQYVSCLCKDYYETRNPDGWAEIARSLKLPYDERLDYHPEFESYKLSSIKQADVVLLGYPLQYPMNETTRANDLKYYESVTRSTGPAMTWSMHAIGHLRLGEIQKANNMFTKSYEDYVREPFKVWTELQNPRVGAVNFLTGAGGFMQALLFGYAGLSIHLDRLQIDSPQLPPNTSRMTVTGIKYLGNSLELNIDENITTLSLLSANEMWPLTLTDGKATTGLKPDNIVILLGEGPFVIQSLNWKDCPLPADTIGHSTSSYYGGDTIKK